MSTMGPLSSRLGVAEIDEAALLYAQKIIFSDIKISELCREFTTTLLTIHLEQSVEMDLLTPEQWVAVQILDIGIFFRKYGAKYCYMTPYGVRMVKN